MSQRYEFVSLAEQAGINFRQLCRRFGVSAKTGYKWRRRYKAGGFDTLADHSRRPRGQPATCAVSVAEEVLALRREHPSWGGRKLRRRLRDLGKAGVPAASTCTAILRRNGLLVSTGRSHTAFTRFERGLPNELRQMDFKGHFPTLAGPRCHPLTVLDDHSRFNLVLDACANEQAVTVRTGLTTAFERYGLPAAMLCDNGAPWGRGDGVSPHTSLTVWL
ncbi:MAG TPA: helix-turn-helix domain-containing protein, partial [Roseimicrobium sp.]|nr:helix-turn-helix domain-containing protein [Roseimicrobium sp.]